MISLDDYEAGPQPLSSSRIPIPARERKDFVVGVQIVVQTRRSAFRRRTVALRDRGLCQPTVESLPDDRSTLRHVLACIGLGFPAKSVPERANRDCTSPVTEAC